MAQTNSRGFPEIGPLYVKMTTPRSDGAVQLDSARDIFGALSLTSQFKVSLHLTNSNSSEDKLMQWLSSSGLTTDLAQNTYYDFYCSEAVIPGATFEVTEESGSRQGIIERFPTRRVYAPITLTFYVDNDYKLLRLFEEWMNFINPLYGLDGNEAGGRFGPSTNGFGNGKNRNDFFRMKYPDDYKRTISIVKFERNFKLDPTIPGGELGNVPSITYRLIEAFPTNITALPVSYEGSTITKTTVEFSYSRYVYEHNRGTIRGA
jgi:hypothetical protein